MASSEVKTLLGLVHQSEEISHLIAEADGELTPDIEAMLAISGNELKTKIDAYGFIIESFKSRQAYALQRMREWEKVASICDTALDNLKDRVKFALAEMDMPEIHGYEFTFKLQANPPAVQVADENLVPGDYLVTETKTTTRIDKTKALGDLKLGKDIPGLCITRSTRLVSKVSQRKDIKPQPVLEKL